MKQIILPFNTGKPELIEVPAPMVRPGEVLIQTTSSVVSSGTERMLMDFGQAGWLGKLRQQPEKAKQVLDKLKTDGILPTIKAVRGKLDRPIPMGYSSAGIALAVGAGIHDIKVGDRVISNGPHAEVVSVARNLVAKIPEGVTDEAGAFTVLGAVALQSIRLVQPSFGETVVVFGLGLIGQLTAQLLLANGCKVIGADLQAYRLKLAAEKGVQPLAEASGDAVRAITGGYGADAVIITASSSNDRILSTAADMCRKRGRIVLTGVVDMKLSRDHFFKKELSFQVSSSYGPGRYEHAYEERGLDYPIGYVRWTEGRNFEAVLTAMQNGQLDIAALISARVPFADAELAYSRMSAPEHLATVFTYGSPATYTTSIKNENGVSRLSKGSGIGIVGAGNFTAGTLVPALKSAKASIQTIISRNGLSATTLASKYGIPQSGTDFDEVLRNDSIGAVVIATPHNTHAFYTAAALRSGRSVFVEKPLALTEAEVEDVRLALASSSSSLTVGFNRRFAPLAIGAKELLAGLGGPFNINITVNAGALPGNHWLLDKELNGGRLIGEACHFIDLCSFFTGAAITAVCANNMGGGAEDVSILLRFADSSNAVVNYFSNGSKAYDKERVELFRAGHTIVIKNWRMMRSYGFGKDVQKRSAQDKGHNALIAAWVKSLNGGSAPIGENELFNSSLATIAVEESLRQNAWIAL